LGKDNLNYSGSDLFGKCGRDWLGKQDLSPAKRQMVEISLKRLVEVKAAITEIDVTIKQKSSNDPRALLLNTIPGIGSVTAFLLLSEIGDIRRFPSSKCFASYFGLVPRLSQSGNHAYYDIMKKEKTYEFIFWFCFSNHVSPRI
jgi:transposase